MKRKLFIVSTAIVSCVALFVILTSTREDPKLVSSDAIKSAAAKSLYVIQMSASKFARIEGCASCHNNTLTSMAVGKGIEKGIPDIDSLKQARVMIQKMTMKFGADNNLVKGFINAKFVPAYVLLGLAAEKYPADFVTDIGVEYLLNCAEKDGSYKAENFRPPMEYGDIHLAALSIRAIQIYAAPAKKEAVNALVSKTRLWMENSNPSVQQEAAFKLVGLYWCGSNPDQIKSAADKLIALQNADGGWSQLPTLKSDAYATGQALYALSESHSVPVDGEVYQKGIKYLLGSQDASGAWVVQTRSNPIQPFKSCGFPPYNEDQFISSAASNWAVMALLNALPDVK
ncbi:MAG: hypothetical protein C5B52_12565 [Bacteroidetes bacterium]|nr:MAG: hypothetical protein C5B52_12565 [Bacteroidota bacterium]